MEPIHYRNWIADVPACSKSLTDAQGPMTKNYALVTCENCLKMYAEPKEK